MKFNQIMVALDSSKMDEKLIQYSHFIAQYFRVKSITFAHVVSDALSRNTPIFDFGNIIDPIFLDKRYKELENIIEAGFNTLKRVDLKIAVLEGKAQKELLKLAKKVEPDLLVLGKKRESSGSIVKAHKIERKAKSAIWFVTEGSTTKIQKILVPVDFSDNSLRALKTALDFKAQLEGVVINVLHVIDIPRTGYKINRNRDLIIAEFKATTVNFFLQLLSQNQIDRNDLEFTTVMNDNLDVAHYIQQAAVQDKSDLIITGAQGNSLLENLIFGSVTEKLVSQERTTPVLVVR